MTSSLINEYNLCHKNSSCPCLAPCYLHMFPCCCHSNQGFSRQQKGQRTRLGVLISDCDRAGLVQCVCTTGRYWGCYPLWPDAGTPEGLPLTLPLTPGPRRPPCSDSRAASSCGRIPEGGAPDTLVSSGRGPAGAAGSSLWKSRQLGLRLSPHSYIHAMEYLFK